MLMITRTLDFIKRSSIEMVVLQGFKTSNANQNEVQYSLMVLVILITTMNLCQAKLWTSFYFYTVKEDESDSHNIVK